MLRISHSLQLRWTVYVLVGLQSQHIYPTLIPVHILQYMTHWWVMRVTESTRNHEHSRTHKGSQRPRTNEVKVDGPDTNLASSKEWYITILSTGNRHYWWQETQDPRRVSSYWWRRPRRVSLLAMDPGSVIKPLVLSPQSDVPRPMGCYYWRPSLILTLNITYLFPDLTGWVNLYTKEHRGNIYSHIPPTEVM